MSEIAHYNVECDWTSYKVALYPEKATVWVVKTPNNGVPYLQELKHRSRIWRRVLQRLRRKSEPGSLAAENLDQCADTR